MAPPLPPLVKAIEDFWEAFRRRCLRRARIPSPLEGWALFAHCPLTVFLLWFLFVAALEGRLAGDALQCRSVGAGVGGPLAPLEDPVRIAVCARYAHFRPQEEGEEEGHVRGYEWHPYVLLAACGLAFLPAMVKRLLAHEALEGFLEEAEALEGRSLREGVVSYARERVGTHEGLLLGRLQVALACLLADAAAALLLDVAALGALHHALHARVPPAALLRRAFPPACNCTVGPLMGLAVGNSETYGCLLPLNWAYEKAYVLLFLYYCLLLPLSLASVLRALFDLLRAHCRRGPSAGPEGVVARKWRPDEAFLVGYLGGFLPNAARVGLFFEVANIDLEEEEDDDVVEAFVRRAWEGRRPPVEVV